MSMRMLELKRNGNLPLRIRNNYLTNGLNNLFWNRCLCENHHPYKSDLDPKKLFISYLRLFESSQSINERRNVFYIFLFLEINFLLVYRSYGPFSKNNDRPLREAMFLIDLKDGGSYLSFFVYITWLHLWIDFNDSFLLRTGYFRSDPIRLWSE